jgi:hypothetical protein
MARADPNAKWYQDQLARARQRRAEAAALRAPRPPGIRSDPERYRAYNREWMRAHYHHKPRPAGGIRHQRDVVVPIPACPCGHPLYEEARAALRGWERNELGGDMDSGAQDLLQDYVTAALCGQDPAEAVARTRRRNYKDRQVLVRGLDRVDDLRR